MRKTTKTIVEDDSSWREILYDNKTTNGDKGRGCGLG